MKKIFILLFTLTFAFSLENDTNFRNRDCSEINNPEECYDLGCEWIVLYEELDNDIIITEECVDFCLCYFSDSAKNFSHEVPTSEPSQFTKTEMF